MSQKENPKPQNGGVLLVSFSNHPKRTPSKKGTPKSKERHAQFRLETRESQPPGVHVIRRGGDPLLAGDELCTPHRQVANLPVNRKRLADPSSLREMRNPFYDTGWWWTGWWNFQPCDSSRDMRCSFYCSHHPAALAEPRGTLVEPWWNPGGTLVEPYLRAAPDLPYLG